MTELPFFFINSAKMIKLGQLPKTPNKWNESLQFEFFLNSLISWSFNP